MKIIKILLLFTLLIFKSSFLLSQDIITTTIGEEIKVKVLEVLDVDIKYKKYSNPDGPIYTMSKSKIQMIVYSNGEKEIFQTKTLSTDSGSNLLLDLTKKGNKVYILSHDINVVKHATERLNRWNYWVVVEDFKQADFVLKFTLNNYVDYFGFAEILEPKTNESLYVTNKFNTLLSLNLNVKRAIVFKIIEEDIIPNFTKYNDP